MNNPTTDGILGPPTAEGTFEVLLRNKGVMIVRLGKSNYFLMNGTWYKTKYVFDADIVAHRVHVPLKAPELKEIYTLSQDDCVVEYYSNVYRATRYNGRTYIHVPGCTVPQEVPSDMITILDKIECERRGYKWPFCP